MSDASFEGRPAARKSLIASDARTKKRDAAEKRFRWYGIAAITVGLLFLLVLAVSIIRAGTPAFTSAVVAIDMTLTQEEFDAAESNLFKTAEYQKLFNAALQKRLTDEGIQVAFDEAAVERLLGKSGATIREHFRANPDQLGQPVGFELSAASRVDGYFKGRVTRDTLQDSRFLQLSDLDLIDALAEAGIIKSTFNWNFITGADTGVDNPGGAGIGASVVGSFFCLLYTSDAADE